MKPLLAVSIAFLLIAPPAAADVVDVFAGDPPVMNPAFTNEEPERAFAFIPAPQPPDAVRERAAKARKDAARARLYGPDIIRPDACLDPDFVRRPQAGIGTMRVEGLDKALNDYLAAEERACLTGTNLAAAE